LPENEPLWYWSPSRGLSLLIGIAYALFTYLHGDAGDVIAMLAFLLLPLACIWFPEPMGDFIGSAGSGFIDRPTPERTIFIAGWVFLFLPILLALVVPLISR
jgi:hypothetical protein